ncbi:MAG: nucleotidyltransferase domain-containing protein [Bacteroidia bacterium]|jgi:hypothetical protein|nr:nucleotidyltransferase domain-containing protein [Bacteroidia bacterium]
MNDIILHKLAEIEQTRNVRILLAAESGSRAWGFASPDSDYDVRFIYAHPEDWYFAITEPRDVIELPVNEVLDINGWDVRKSLRLLNKSNPVLLEWMQSPVLYCADENFLQRFKDVAEQQFSPIAVAFHYLSMAKNKFSECRESETVKLKHYLYSIRSTLALKWVVQRQTIPPMQLSHLLAELNDEFLTARVSELVSLKAEAAESYRHTHETGLENWLADTLAYCEQAAPKLPGSKANTEMLNEFFRHTVRRT